jgi:hypothetical protein
LVKGFLDIHFSEGVCEGCILGKHPEEKFEKGKPRRASSSLDLVHSDLMGPFPHLSIRKSRYVLTFIDDYSCYTWVYFLRKKYEVFEHLKEFKALVETHTRKKVKILHIDNGGGISTNIFRIFVVRMVSSCIIQFHTLHNRMELLKGRTNISRR